MKTTNLTQNYITNILEKDNLDLYKKSMPELLGHYFKYWALEDYFHKSLKTEKEVIEKTEMIKSRLDFIKSKLSDFGFDTSNIEIILFVGQNCTNGHAFEKDGKFVVWLPVEAYESSEDIDIFVTHEIIHNLHYSVNPDFYFKTKDEKINVGRQIITEGLATYLTSKVLNISDDKALWADFLNEKELKSWFDGCKEKRFDLYDLVLKNFDLSKENIQIFWANDPSDVYKYRSGYFVGLELIKEFVEKEKVSDIDILKIDRKSFE
ncbi:hypothetical protein KKC45_00300, partial [Patescibacteria group bacterium]|nr:hypothetical protein [Patescibacteria group bacterium]